MVIRLLVSLFCGYQTFCIICFFFLLVVLIVTTSATDCLLRTVVFHMDVCLIMDHFKLLEHLFYTMLW